MINKSSLENKISVTLPIKDIMEPLTGFTKPPVSVINNRKSNILVKLIPVALLISAVVYFIIYWV